MNPKVMTGLESCVESLPKWLADCRIGLLCNPASVDSRFYHAKKIFKNLYPKKLSALFSPQHGFFAEKQDNMVESGHMTDPLLNIPIFSLYGETRTPTKEMMDHIDVMVIDIQDVGTRVYTFIYTMSYCMEAAKKYGKKIVVLDRPNPLGGIMTEGNCLDENCKSFVGRFPIPMRHGLTIGEIALLFNDHFEIGCDLEVIPMKGWKRKMLFKDTGLPWVVPSPNLPTPDSAIVYPGQVLWEGTNVSEGRGTTLPFSLFGAPFFNVDEILNYLKDFKMPGIILRPHCFEPVHNKWTGELCRGFQIHVTDHDTYQPYKTTLILLDAIMHLYPKSFEWKQPPYEYEFKKLPVDLIIGDKDIRISLENGENIDEIEKKWQAELNNFKQLSKQYHLYS